MQREIDQLEQDVMELQREVQGLQQKILTAGSEISSSKDARKMYGDTTPGDVTHQDVTLEYSGYFKHAFRNLPKSLQGVNLSKYEIWEMCADIMKSSYDANKEEIIEEMISKMRHALTADKNSLTEDNIDLLRAFSFLIHYLPLEEIKHKVTENGSNPPNKEAVDVAMDIITMLPPIDHQLVINGDKTGKEGASKEPKASRNTKDAVLTEDHWRSGNTLAPEPIHEAILKRKCAACGQLFSRNEMGTYHLGKYYHRHHSICGNCKRPIELDNWKYTKSKTYCLSCLCTTCGEPLGTGEVLATQDGDHYHPSCLHCIRCKSRDNLIKVERNLICQKCYSIYYKKLM